MDKQSLLSLATLCGATFTFAFAVLIVIKSFITLIDETIKKGRKKTNNHNFHYSKR